MAQKMTGARPHFPAQYTAAGAAPPTTEYRRRGRKDLFMAFFNSAVGVLQTLVVALGAGLGIWGVINLMEGYGNDNPGANAHVR